jgi:hypothetical protein
MIKIEYTETNKELLNNIFENKAVFESNGISVEFGDNIYPALKYLYTGVISKDEFCTSIVDKNSKLFFTLIAQCPEWTDDTPLRITVSYKDKQLLSTFLNKETYSAGIPNCLLYFANFILSSYIPDITQVISYSEGDAKGREYLLSMLDTNKRRAVDVWAVASWIKHCFPETYNKMTQQDEFLTVEELKQIMDEAENKG